jgi:murein L,D-transpeptidase YafK
MLPATALIPILCFGIGLPVQLPAAEDWLLIDTRNYTLTVMRGEHPLTLFESIAIGQNGTSRSRLRNDGQTPLGRYRINAIRDSSQFYRFFAFDYPNFDDARDAMAAGIIDEDTFAAIRRAHEHGRAPPQDTPLGGNLGIHGVGNGDLRVHEDFNWTDGCIALTNEQIDALTPYVVPGMIVVIY